MQLEAAGDKWIRVIALFKLVKAVLLIIVGIGVLKLLHRDVVYLSIRFERDDGGA